MTDMAHKAAKNTTSIIVGDVVVKIISLIVSIYLARYLGVEKFGLYSFVIVYVTFFRLLGNFGLDLVVVKEVARYSHLTEKVINHVLGIRIITSLGAIALATIIIRNLDYSEDTVLYVSLVSVIIFFQCIGYLFESLFQANLKMQYFTVAVIAQKVIFGFLIALAIFYGGDIFHVLLALVASEISRFSVDIFYSRKFGKFKPRIDITYSKHLISSALPFFVSASFYMIYYRVDVLMLSYMSSNASVGFYSAAYGLTDPFLFLPTALASTLTALMSHQFVNKADSLKRTYCLGARYLSIIIFPLVIAVFVLSDKFILFIYGADFLNSSSTLKILIFSLLFNSLNSVQSSALISIDMQKVNTIAFGFCCLINLVLNAILIPIYDFKGAAIATVISVAFLYFISYYLVSKNVVRIPASFYVKPIISAVFMGYLLSLASSFNLLFLIIIGFVTYASSMVILKGFNSDDRLLLNKLFKKI